MLLIKCPSKLPCTCLLMGPYGVLTFLPYSVYLLNIHVDWNESKPLQGCIDEQENKAPI